MAVKDTDYMYSCARIRALEGSICGRDRLSSLLDAKSAADVASMIAEAGVNVVRVIDENGDGTDDRIDYEATLTGILASAYALVDSMAPDPSVFAFLRYPYDCNNIKTFIKCSFCGAETDGMLFDIGSVGADVLTGALSEGRTDPLPENMASAFLAAREAYSKTSDPRTIDMILDRACYEDMLDGAKRTGSDFMISAVTAKIDLTNFMMCLRVLRMDMGEAGASLLAGSLLEGGELGPGFFKEAYENGERALIDSFSYTRYGRVTSALSENAPLSVFEKACDDFYMEMIRAARYVPFGAPILFAYLAAREYEVKNIRIIIAGKMSGLPAETIRERMRQSYV